jgi:uncharacterized protein (DUF2267 family)
MTIMTFDRFLGEVQHRARLASTGEALRATQAVLQTLGERIDFGEAKDLAAQLPRELAPYLGTEQHGVRLSLDDFFRKVSGRALVDIPAAVYQVRVVLEVLQYAVSPGEIANVRRQLPPEWGPLFEEGSEGKIRLRDAA